MGEWVIRSRRLGRGLRGQKDKDLELVPYWKDLKKVKFPFSHRIFFEVF